MRQRILLNLCSALILMFLGVPASGKGAEAKSALKLKSLFPLGGSQGSSYDVVLRGENLDGAYAVWLDCDRLQAEIRDVREIEADEPETETVEAAAKATDKTKKYHEVRIAMTIDRAAGLGAHALRLATSRGITGALWHFVDAEPSVLETGQPHARLAEAQPLSVPQIVNGRLAKAGEVDIYSFEVTRGQELQLEVRASELPPNSVSADPQLVLYDPVGSWFDPGRGVPLEATDLWRPPLGEEQATSHRLPRVRRVFEKAGRYAAEVGTVDGHSGPNYAYQLRITRVDRAKAAALERWGPLVPAAHAGERVAWKKRNFTAAMGTDWLSRIASRSGRSAPVTLGVVSETEPNDVPDQALEVPVPAIVKGVVSRPGDVDWFQIQAKAGDKLAFEAETPFLPPPFFNARVALFDPGGQELATNIYRALGGDGDDWIKTLVPKLLYTFDKAGAYRFQVRDLTSRLGGEEFRYRLMVRPQVPHVGEVAIRGVDCVRLVAGGSQTLKVDAELEEGFEGEVALAAENLPPGVSAAAVVKASDRGSSMTAKPGGQLHRERHFGQQQAVSIILLADADAPSTSQPHAVRLVARPVLEGKATAPLLAQEILVTVAGAKRQVETVGGVPESGGPKGAP